ncbi:MAG: hypothetical protein R2874_16890 [Desulfobacterales bacterium]
MLESNPTHPAQTAGQNKEERSHDQGKVQPEQRQRAQDSKSYDEDYDWEDQKEDQKRRKKMNKKPKRPTDTETNGKQ